VYCIICQNARDVDIYLFMEDGVYLYDACKHVLEPVMPGDFRSQLMMTPLQTKDAVGPPPPRAAPSNPTYPDHPNI